MDTNTESAWDDDDQTVLFKLNDVGGDPDATLLYHHPNEGVDGPVTNFEPENYVLCDYTGARDELGEDTIHVNDNAGAGSDVYLDVMSRPEMRQSKRVIVRPRRYRD
jgi:hypothetical protein